MVAPGRTVLYQSDRKMSLPSRVSDNDTRFVRKPQNTLRHLTSYGEARVFNICLQSYPSVYVVCAEGWGGGVKGRRTHLLLLSPFLPFPPRRAGLHSCGSLHIGDESRGSAPPTDSFRGFPMRGNVPRDQIRIPHPCWSSVSTMQTFVA